jgi:hypothetical protein
MSIEQPSTPIFKTLSTIETRREEYDSVDEFRDAWKEYCKYQNYFYEKGDCYVCIDGHSVYCPARKY